ncbi:MAG: methytransferase partner Trm112 [Chloroflexi bacterium]|nr:methytransferase partner Trm112 [Chloroflexota bacterium]
MRKDLMDILACPMCKSELELTTDEVEGEEVIRGSLFCAKCNERYPIEDGIPNLLPPDLRKAAEAEAS